MSYLFSGCSSLKKLVLSNFNTDNVIDMNYLLFNCSDELKTKIKILNKNIREEAIS